MWAKALPGGRHCRLGSLSRPASRLASHPCRAGPVTRLGQGVGVLLACHRCHSLIRYGIDGTTCDPQSAFHHRVTAHRSTSHHVTTSHVDFITGHHITRTCAPSCTVVCITGHRIAHVHALGGLRTCVPLVCAASPHLRVHPPPADEGMVRQADEGTVRQAGGGTVRHVGGHSVSHAACMSMACLA